MSPCLFFIKKLVLNLTNPILTAGASHWPIFGGFWYANFGVFARSRELVCFEGFVIFWRRTLAVKLAVRVGCAFAHFRGRGCWLEFNQIGAKFPYNFRGGYSKISLCPFSGTRQFFKFFSEPRVAAHSTSARFRGLRITEKVSFLNSAILTFTIWKLSPTGKSWWVASSSGRNLFFSIVLQVIWNR